MCGFQQKGKRKHMYPCLTPPTVQLWRLQLIGSVSAGKAINWPCIHIHTHTFHLDWSHQSEVAACPTFRGGRAAMALV